ncbi:MAG: organoarsenical effux MFS transporter ArsJ [Planctomycetota bacterium]
MRSVRDYAVVTGAYWVFTVTDGALRMLVLLHLNTLGYKPLEIASLFLFYEVFGVVTNFVGGWLGSRFGLRSTLFSGLSLQLAALWILAREPAALTLPIVMIAQGLSGVAKDLTKMSSKSYIKLVVPEGDSKGLMKWVAILTGSKNTLKGVGFFVGGALLSRVGFRGACLWMAGAIGVALLVSVSLLPGAMGKAKAKLGLGAVVSRDPRINWLSVARLFLFGSRDVWFVLALPIYFSTVLGWSFSRTGGFLALWVIGYGIVQALAPRYLRSHDAPDAARLGWWTAALVVPLAAIMAALGMGWSPSITLTVGLAIFGVVFATNSAVHSFLIVHYAEEDKVSLAVGFYYMANAAGRLLGTLLSGALFQWGGEGQTGLLWCIGCSIVLVVLSRIACTPLRQAEVRAPAVA